LPDARPRPTAGRNAGSNSQPEPERPPHRLSPFRQRPRGRRRDAWSLRLRRPIALLTP
jgi:hypothetical protein